ncbi:hypothetical protein QLQ80_03020 [Mycoplasma sp. M5725]|uniref:Uncharacterized protein n=1 Tax=Mycoplasma phocimorsus TaxID=3045839 RepID=A0AAJ1UX11_9MOLU|nr:hypothetical protein [Mycoplasma phocimorsus]MDJ1646035.1 hypothetical protein [Mycoplasma phocimorsus]
MPLVNIAKIEPNKNFNNLFLEKPHIEKEERSHLLKRTNEEVNLKLQKEEKKHIHEKPKREQREVSLKSQLISQTVSKSSVLTFPWTTILYSTLGLAGTGLFAYGLYEAGKRIFGKPKGWYVWTHDRKPPFHIEVKNENPNEFWTNLKDNHKRISPGNGFLYLPYPDKYKEKNTKKLEIEIPDFKDVNNIKYIFTFDGKDWKSNNNKSSQNNEDIYFKPVY